VEECPIVGQIGGHLIWYEKIKSIVGYLSAIMIVNGFLFSPACRADELTDLKNRVKELEDRFNDELLFQRDEHLTLFDQINDTINLNMYISLDYESFKKSRSRFKADSLELVSEINFRGKMAAFFEIEFNGDEAEIEQGWFEYLIDPVFTPRLGAILVPFGSYNLHHFNYRRALAQRPLAMKHVVPVTWREAGAGFTGGLLTRYGEGKWINELQIDYQFFFVNGFTENFETNSSREARGAFSEDNNNNKGTVGRIEIILSNGGVGFSAYHGKYDNQNKRDISGLDVDWQLTLGSGEFLGEYAYFSLEDPSAEIPNKLQGGYAQVNYNFWPKSLNDTFLGRGHEDPALILVLRYGEAKIKGNFDKNEEYRWTTGINYRPYQTFVARIEYQWNQTIDEPIEHGDKDGLIISFAAAF